MKLEDIVDYIEYVKYKPETIQIVLQDETIDVMPDFVSEVFIEYDYDNLYAPVMTLTMALSQEEYRKIVLEKDTVQFIIKINKYFYDDKGNFLYSSNFVNGTFCTHMLDETPIMEKDLHDMTKLANSVEETEEKDGRTPMDMKDVYDFALFNENNVRSGNKDINICIESGAMTDTIVYALTQAGIGNLLMTPVDNNSTISNMVLPLMNTVEFLNYLQANKGIYNLGLLFFMDFNLNFLIDKNAYCTAWRPNEYKITNIYILSQKSEYCPIVGQYIDSETEENNVFTSSESINIVNRSVVNNVTFGNKKVLLNAKNDNVSYIDEGLKQRGESITTIEIEKQSNSYTKNEHKMRLIENEYDVNVIMKDIDFELLSPNKCFKLIFQNTDVNGAYGGTYRVSKSMVVLTKMGNELDSYLICEFKKQNNYSNEFGADDKFEDWWINSNDAFSGNFESNYDFGFDSGYNYNDNTNYGDDGGVDSFLDWLKGI